MPNSTDQTLDLAFSDALRMATASAHRDAERNTFLGRLLSGGLPIEDYGRLIVQHRAIYEALESANAAMATDQVASHFVRDEVLRLPALERDLVAVLGDSWPERPEAEVLPSTMEYCGRLLEVGATWPSGWIGHQYVRYLGDLSGGLHIRMALESVFGIDEDTGTAFYDFPKVPDPVAWKDDYRARLDRVPWDEDEQALVVDEVLEAYRLNTAIFAELER